MNIVVPDYELIRCIGHGAYGQVWLARNVTGSFVAVKVVTRGAFDHDRPFEREFEGIKRFEPISRSDPSQVAILHVSRGDQFFYYVMELADPVQRMESEPPSNGETVRPNQGPHLSVGMGNIDQYVPHTLREDLRRHGRLPVSRCVKIGLALTRALACLHRYGLVHRDVKASNVIFVGGVPKLSDIGLVTSVDATRSLVGTEGYMAPEGPGTPQADIYSMGKLLYEITTGCDRKEFPMLPADIATRPDCAALIELNAIVTRACQFDPVQRYIKAEQMIVELELLQQGQSVHRKRWRSRCRVMLWRAGIAIAGLVALIMLIHRLHREGVPRLPDPDGPRSTNPEANRLWEQGMAIVWYDRYREFPRAYTNFQKAIRLDPQFVRPYVGWLELRYRQYVPALGLTPEEELQMITRQLEKLGPNLAATHVARSTVAWADWDYPRAQDCLLQAIRAGPNYELAHTTYAFKLTLWGYTDKAREELAMSENLRPSKATIYRVRGQTYYVERDYTNAMVWARKALEYDPKEAVAYYTIGCAYRAMGDYTNALDNLELARICEIGDSPTLRNDYSQLRQALQKSGPRGYWLEFLQQTGDSEFYWKAVAHRHLGNTNDALAWLEKSCAKHERWPGSHDGPLSYLILDQDWDGLRDHPIFRAVVDKVGFTKLKPPRRR